MVNGKRSAGFSRKILVVWATAAHSPVLYQVPVVLSIAGQTSPPVTMAVR